MLRHSLIPCLAASLLFLACDNSTGPSLPGSPAEAKIVSLTATTLSVAAASDNWPEGKTRIETFTWKAK